MKNRPRFSQYCPLAMASEILATRWTMLILRELMEGSTGFNDIARGVPLMSRTLLSSRLKDLERAGIVTRESGGKGRPVAYRLTEGGAALGPVLRQVAEWGQEWLDIDSSLDDDDTDFLMWDIHRNLRLPADIPDPFVIQFSFPDAPELRQLHWITVRNGSHETGFVDPGIGPDVTVEARLGDMKQIWMGWLGYDKAAGAGLIEVDGPDRFTRDVPSWLGLSSVAHIPKRPVEQRLLRA